MRKTNLILMFMLLLSMAACHKDTEMNEKEPKVSNEELTVLATSARFSWNVDFSGQFQTGVELSQNESMTDVRRVEATKQDDKYMVIANSLSEGTKYYYRIVVWNKFNNYEFEVKSFTTYTDCTITLTCSPEEGGTTTGGGTYTIGDTCTVAASVNSGFSFVNWTENGNQVSTEASYSFTVTSDRHLMANFSAQEYSISATVAPEEGGTVSGGGDFHYGDTCTLMASAATGYRFVNWTRDDVVVSGTTTYAFKVTESSAFVAHFEEMAFDLVVSASPEIIAQGGSAQLEAAASGGNGNFIYSWDHSSSLSNATVHNPLASPSATTTYTCTVTSGHQSQSASCTITVVCPPTNLNAEAHDNEVLLTWDATDPADSYKIYRNNVFLFHTTTATTTYTDSGLDAGTYSYQVSAVYSGVESPKSDPTQADIYSPLNVTAEANPSTIPYGSSTSLTANVSGGNGSIIYSWTPTTGLNDANVQSPTATPSVTTTYTVVVESNGQTAETSVTVNVVNAPNNLAASVQNNNVHLTWSSTIPSDGYKVYRGNSMIAQIGSITSYDDEGLGTGTYSYQVSAIYQGVESPKSNTAQAVIEPQVPVGAINGIFTINSSHDMVYFSQGNLQYKASTGTWRFATNQWDFVGGTFNGNVYGNVFENGVQSDNALISPTYDGWIDFFGWGTSGWNSGNTYYHPWDTNNSNGTLYGPTGYHHLTGSYSNADWGVNNAISNGGNQPGIWRTLTTEEWEYVLNGREGYRFAKAKIINGDEIIKGVMLLPDHWDTNIHQFQNPNYFNATYDANPITMSEWIVLEQAGVVFLPAAGYRNGTNLNAELGMAGHYWSASSHNDVDKAYNISFSFSYLQTDYYYRFGGESVRLVCPVESVY